MTTQPVGGIGETTSLPCRGKRLALVRGGVRKQEIEGRINNKEESKQAEMDG